MGVAKWKYKNNGETPIFWGRILWGPGEEKETPNPVPSSTGLDCTQEGTLPDPVLFHDDLIIQPGETKQVDMDGPRYTHQVALSIFRMSGGGVEYRFMSDTNTPLPLDTRGFVHVVPWEMCARMFFKNVSGEEAQVSVSAVEVIR